MNLASDKPVDVILNDRFCLSCGESLHGEPISREPHYNMLITHCRRCHHVAPVQETSRLSRTAQRWGGLALGFWMLMMAALWVGGSTAMFGITQAVAEDASRSMADFIQNKYEQFQPDDADGNFQTDVQVILSTAGAPPKIIINHQDEELLNRFGTWWKQQDSKAVLADSGGMWGVIPWARLWPWLIFSIFPFAFGVIWSILMLNVRRSRFIVALPMIVFLLAGLCLMMLLMWQIIPVQSPSAAARTLIGPFMMIATMVYVALLLFLGMLSGRSILRGIVKLTLSPRAISRMSGLWQTDGYQPPRVRSTRVV